MFILAKFMLNSSCFYRCCQDIGESAIEEKVCKYVPNIVQWINKHCNFDGKNSVRDISILNVEDIEENVWCPKYGVKGKIDMTVNVQCPGQENSKVISHLILYGEIL